MTTENPNNPISGLGINLHEKDENLHRMDDFDNHFELKNKRKELLKSFRKNIPPDDRISSEKLYQYSSCKLKKKLGMFIRDGFRTDGSFLIFRIMEEYEKSRKFKVHFVDKANDIDTAPCQSAIPFSLIDDALD